MALVSGVWVWSRPSLGSIDGVKVSWCSRGMTVKDMNVRKIERVQNRESSE